jgi:GntR family transcriptional regulator
MYMLAKDKLASLIANGTLVPDQKLPRETDLAEMLGVSRTTIRTALKLAQQEGLIIQKHGHGTFVSSMPSIMHRGLEALESIDTACRRNGWECLTKDLKVEIKPLGEKIASKLERKADELGVYVSRVKIVNGQILAFTRDVFPEELASVEELEANFEGSVLDFFIKRGKPVVKYAWANVSAILPDTEISQVLGVSRDTPLLLAEEIVFSEDNEPFDYSLNYQISERIEFHIFRTLSPDYRKP